MMTATALGIDLGGTKVEIMRVEASGSIQDRARIPTPADGPDATLAAIAEAARPLLTETTTNVGVGAAGLIGTGGVMRYAANLGWPETPIAANLEDALHLPTMVENDANVAAWGEYRLGAGVGATSMLCVTVGTGLGGGLILDGRLFRGAYGSAGEIGHIIVEPGGPLCGCGNHGCLEQVASGRAIQRAGQGAAADDPSGAIASLVGGDPSKVTGQIVTQAAQSGDKVATEILREVGTRLGEGIAGLVNVLDTDRVVIGGGACEAGDLLLGPTRDAFHDSLEAPSHRPEVPIVVASLGNDAGAVGAAILALEGADAVWGTR